MARVQWQIQRRVESPFDLKFHLQWTFWINLIDFGHFSFYFSSKSQQILLPVNVCKIAGGVENSVLRRLIWAYTFCSGLSVQIRIVCTVI